MNPAADPFMKGLRFAFSASLVMPLIAALASWLRGSKYVHDDTPAVGAPVGAEAGLEAVPA